MKHSQSVETEEIASSYSGAEQSTHAIGKALNSEVVSGTLSKDINEVAMNAISTSLAISGWTLAVMGLVVAVVAFFGWHSIVSVAKTKSERIANKRFDDYITTEEFKSLVQNSIDASIERRWQDAVVANNIAEERRDDDDPSPFKEGANG